MSNGLVLVLLCASLWIISESSFIKDLHILNKVRARDDMLQALRMKLTEKQRRLDAKRLADAKLKAMLDQKQRARQELWLRQKSRGRTMGTRAPSAPNIAMDWDKTTASMPKTWHDSTNSNVFHVTDTPRQMSKTDTPEKIPDVLNGDNETDFPDTAKTDPAKVSNSNPQISTPKKKPPQMDGELSDSFKLGDRGEQDETLTNGQRTSTTHTMQRNDHSNVHPTSLKSSWKNVSVNDISRGTTKIYTSPLTTVPVDTSTSRNIEHGSGARSSGKKAVTTDQNIRAITNHGTSTIQVSKAATGSRLPLHTTTWDPWFDPDFSGPLGVAVLEDVTLAHATNEETGSSDSGSGSGIQMLSGGTMPAAQQPQVQSTRDSNSDIVSGFLSSISNWFSRRRGASSSNSL